MPVTSQEALRAQKESQRFTKIMMKSKHQWEAEDLEAAGLNRILTMGGGTPIGASPAPFGPSSAQEVASMGGGVAAGIKAATEAAIMKSTKEKAASDAVAAKHFEETSFNQAGLAGSQWTVANEQALQQRIHTKALQATVPLIKKTHDLNASNYATKMLWLQRGASSAGSILGGSGAAVIRATPKR